MNQLFRVRPFRSSPPSTTLPATGEPVRVGAASDETRRFNHLMPSLVEAAPR